MEREIIDGNIQLRNDALTMIEGNTFCVKRLWNWQRQFRRGMIIYKELEEGVFEEFDAIVYGNVTFLRRCGEYDFSVRKFDLQEVINDVLVWMVQKCILGEYEYRITGPTEVCE